MLPVSSQSRRSLFRWTFYRKISQMQQCRGPRGLQLFDGNKRLCQILRTLMHATGSGDCYYSKARFKRRISYVPNLIHVLNACEVRRLAQIKFDNATSGILSHLRLSQPNQYSTEVQPLLFVPNRIFKSCLIYYNPQFSIFSQLFKISLVLRRLKGRILILFK